MIVQNLHEGYYQEQNISTKTMKREKHKTWQTARTLEAPETLIAQVSMECVFHSYQLTAKSLKQFLTSDNAFGHVQLLIDLHDFQ